MLKARQGGFGGIQQIAQHGDIACHIFNARLPMRRAGSVDNMRNVRPRRDGAGQPRPIPKIGGDPGDAHAGVAPGQANRREAGVAFCCFQHAAGGGAAGANNQGDAGIGHNDILRPG